LKSIEKIKRKAFGKSLEKEKAISAHSAQPSLAKTHARPLRLTGGSHLSATARVRALSFPPSRCAVGPISRHRFPRVRAPTLSILRARLVNAMNRSPARSLSHAVRWASPVSSVFPATAVDPRPRVHRGDHPHHLPTCPSSLLRLACTHSLSPASFCTL
jgi:hypothetical protein